jgi:hypothetical protein
MMHLPCEHCGKEGSIEDQVYLGKRLRLKCPYCSGDFVYRVPPNGSSGHVLSDRTRAQEAAVPHPVVTPGRPDRIVMAPSAETTVPPASSETAAAVAPVQADEALVTEAKRIARLIISEIKLYNQEKVAKSRNKREVLELLKNDLIKGKQHYNTRIASKLPMGPDYFMETVKEILLAGKG